MDRTETKCTDLKRYAAKEPAAREADRQTAATNLKQVAYPCDCMGWHVERIDPIPLTPNQRAIAELTVQCGDDSKLLDVVLTMRKREMDKYHAAYIPKRRVRA